MQLRQRLRDCSVLEAERKIDLMMWNLEPANGKLTTRYQVFFLDYTVKSPSLHVGFLLVSVVFVKLALHNGVSAELSKPPLT